MLAENEKNENLLKCFRKKISNPFRNLFFNCELKQEKSVFFYRYEKIKFNNVVASLK